MNDSYNTDPDFDKMLRVIMTLFFLLLLWAFYGCASHKEVIDISTHDTLTIVKTDTVKEYKEKEVNVTQFVDRWNDRYVVVNPLTGDTVKDVQKQIIYINNSTLLKDSASRVESKADSVADIKERTQYVTKEKELTWWQRFKMDTYIYTMIAMLAIMATIVVYSIYKIRKIC